MLDRMLSYLKCLLLIFIFSTKHHLLFADLPTDEKTLERIDLMEKEIKELKKELYPKTQYTAGEGIEIQSTGLTIHAGATFILQGTHNANGDGLAKSSRDTSDASYSVDLHFEKKFDDSAMAYLRLESGNGTGVGNDLKIFSGTNMDVSNSNNRVSITRIFYEHYFKDLPLTFTFGKIGPSTYLDRNKYANDECYQFLGNAFVNSPVIGFPDNNTFGCRFSVATNLLDIELAALDANADGENIFDNVFFSGQFNLKPNFQKRQGNYRLYGWLNNKDHIEWNDASQTKKKNYGFGLSCDQELTDCMGAFARYGWQNPKVYSSGSDFSLEQFWSVGLQVIGKNWDRLDDTFALAFGQIIPSNNYKKVNRLKGKSEKHFEAYYHFKMYKQISITPDLQIIWNPYGTDAANGSKTIFVGGIRAHLNF